MHILFSGFLQIRKNIILLSFVLSKILSENIVQGQKYLNLILVHLF